jgi:hypothetical protein
VLINPIIRTRTRYVRHAYYPTRDNTNPTFAWGEGGLGKPRKPFNFHIPNFHHANPFLSPLLRPLIYSSLSQIILTSAQSVSEIFFEIFATLFCLSMSVSFVGYLTALFQYRDYIASEGMIMSKWKGLEGSCNGLVEALAGLVFV